MRILSFLFISLFTSSLTAQDKKLSNELIWASREFSTDNKAVIINE